MTLPRIGNPNSCLSVAVTRKPLHPGFISRAYTRTVCRRSAALRGRGTASNVQTQHVLLACGDGTVFFAPVI
ncbi:hypothetical protein KCP70_11050 [Salmonella enterica subsp. enterica]|nr:hypothetical protein KCP70_11050 [Salmonella enterica subsp. enterica]